MKLQLNKILVGLCAVFAALCVSGQSIKSGALTNGINNILTVPGALFQIDLLNNGTNTATYTLYDNDSTTSTNLVRPAYSIVTIARATNNVIWTNTLGRLQTNSEVYLSQTSGTQAATTNEATRLAMSTLATSASSTIAPASAYTFGLGLQILNTGVGGTYILRYNPLP